MARVSPEDIDEAIYLVRHNRKPASQRFFAEAGYTEKPRGGTAVPNALAVPYSAETSQEVERAIQQLSPVIR